MPAIKKRKSVGPIIKTKKELVGLKLTPSLVKTFDLVAEYSGIKRNAFYQQVLEYGYWNCPVQTDEGEEFNSIHDAYINAIIEKEERTLQGAQDYIDYLNQKGEMQKLENDFDINEFNIENKDDIENCKVCKLKAFDTNTDHCYFCGYTVYDE